MIKLIENTNNVGEYSYLIISRIRKDKKFRDKLHAKLYDAYKKSLLTKKENYVCIYTDGREIECVKQIDNSITPSAYADWMRITTFNGKDGLIDELDESHFKQHARYFYTYLYDHFDEIDDLISNEVAVFMNHVEDCYDDYIESRFNRNEE